MVSVKSLIGAATAALLSTAACAADLGLPPPPLPPAPAAEQSGWYLRGDIGMSNQHVGQLFNAQDNTATTFANVDTGFDAAPIFGIGLGYDVNNWLRFDVTAQYRGNANFHGMDIYYDGSDYHDDSYSASKSELTFLVNGYVDLGTWWCITPYVGAGVGVSRNTISNFRDLGLSTGSDAYAGTASEWSLAWALHGGLAYTVTPNLTIQLAYTYLDLGDAKTQNAVTYDGNVFPPFEFRHLTSNDFMLGVRWALQPEPAPAPPLSTRG